MSRSMRIAAATVMMAALLEGQQIGVVAKGDARLLAYLSVGSLKELLLQTIVRSSKAPNAQHLTDHLFAFLSEASNGKVITRRMK